MGGLFAKEKATPPSSKKSSEAQITTKDRAMLDLKVARDKLKKFQKRVLLKSLDIS